MEKPKTPVDLIDNIINSLEDILERKKTVYKRIEELEKDKYEISKSMPTLIKEIKRLTKRRIEKFMSNKAPYLLSPVSKIHRNRIKETRKIKKLIKKNKDLFPSIRELFILETYLIRNSETIKTTILNHVQYNDEISTLFENLERLLAESPKILNLLKTLFNLEKTENLDCDEILKLLTDKHMKNKLNEKWIKEAALDEKEIKRSVEKDFRDCNKLKESIDHEKYLLGSVISALEKNRTNIVHERPSTMGVLKPLNYKHDLGEWLRDDVIYLDPEKGIFSIGKENKNINLRMLDWDKDKSVNLWFRDEKWYVTPNNCIIELNLRELNTTKELEDINKLSIGEYKFEFRIVKYDPEKIHGMKEIFPSMPITFRFPLESRSRMEIEINGHDFFLGDTIELKVTVEGFRDSVSNEYQIVWKFDEGGAYEGVIETTSFKTIKEIPTRKLNISIKADKELEECSKVVVELFKNRKLIDLKEKSISIERPYYVMLYYEPGQSFRKYILKDNVIIGSDQDNDIVLRPYADESLNNKIQKKHMMFFKKGYYMYVKILSADVVIYRGGKTIYAKKNTVELLDNAGTIFPLKDSEEFKFTISKSTKDKVTIDRDIKEMPDKIYIIHPSFRDLE